MPARGEEKRWNFEYNSTKVCHFLLGIEHEEYDLEKYNIIELVLEQCLGKCTQRNSKGTNLSILIIYIYIYICMKFMPN